MHLRVSTSSNARRGDRTANGSHQRIVVALTMLSLTAAAILSWQVLLDQTGDALIAALLVGLVIVTLIAPAARLLRS